MSPFPVDYLLDEDMNGDDVRLLPQINDLELLRKFEILDTFPQKERDTVKEIVDALIFRNDIKARVTS